MTNISINCDKVYLVTVNYTSQQALIELTTSIKLLNFDISKIKLLIVDSSNDLNSNFLNLPKELESEIIALPENRGFAYALNIGLKTARCQASTLKGNSFIWIINPDTRLHPESLKVLLENSQPDQILGSLISQEGFEPKCLIWGAGGFIDQNLDVSMGKYNQPLSEAGNIPFECDYVPGCSMFFPSNILADDFPFLPEEYFLYFEETDWCIKLREKGLMLKIIPSCLVEHKSEPAKMESQFRVYFYNRNSNLFKLWNYKNTKDKFKLLLKIALGIPKLCWLVIKEKNPALRKTFTAHLYASIDTVNIFLKLKSNLSILSARRLKYLLKP